MKKLTKLFNSYSFLTKIICSLILFSIFFIFIKVALTSIKIENRKLNDEIKYITKSLLLTKEEIKIIGKSLRMQGELEVDLTKKNIENEIKYIDLKTDKQTSKEHIIDILQKSIIPNYCSYKISNDIKYIKENDYFEKNDINILENWQTAKIGDINKAFYQKDYFFYNYLLKDLNLLVEIGCNKSFLNLNHMGFEMSLKEHLKPTLLMDSSLDSTKMAVFWINPKIMEDLDSVLFEENKEIRKTKYTISMLSNVENIPTGNLTLKEILKQKNTNEPIIHKINEKEVLTWIIDLSSNNSSRELLLAYSIDKKQLEEKNHLQILFLLPETLLAIGISFLLILFFFRRIINNINTLTKTAIKVNNGEKNIRSNVKGDDAIGILGKSFDCMLDNFENNIKILDEKVIERTKEITKSLEEKEILLKEIHHRVKNNLALTISLIELQEEEIEDKKTKKVLVDITERIYTMELLHRKLYESTNLNKISFDSYVMDLIETISKSYDKEKNVRIKASIENIDLNIETAMPYGIILNELITNCFKYAFKNQDEPKLEITISKKNNEEISLILKDNGKGLSKDFSKLSNETLGLRLINMIVNFQLMGKVIYEFDNGAKFTILGKIKE
ncbi:histidine kinase dimerization/phosphoacceptor domain -containing protein [Aliarcobacter butzleri]|uniref:histidine kinase dimerization/phosphoacceptor domain -containing protein n=1 Tax=Aliarcobacter butzleri TaxID=28197 RepID=UPI0021B462DE|nr:histidine kinase dimerization/phosphoacceptor domain -containing protein [Aliarcobacter butzleri]MCT7554593.1 histidine kinase [Aliarcobacter butzleri]MDN5076962.1 histidine kinase [Aliarcobacter butzleri]MDN5118210.1 histidine kinase dimerization/phosphoacceptor domain -containing protein [Aliarcobacter butzleri]